MDYENRQVDEQAVNNAKNNIREFFSRIGRSSFYNYAIHDIEEPRTGYFNLAGNSKELRLGLIGDKDKDGNKYTLEQLKELDAEFVKLIQEMQKAQGYINEMSNDIRNTEARAIGDFFSSTEEKDELFDFFTNIGKEDSYIQALEYIKNPKSDYFNLAVDANKNLRLNLIGKTDILGKEYTLEQLDELDAKFVDIIENIQKQQGYANNASKDLRNSTEITGNTVSENNDTEMQNNDEIIAVEFDKFDKTIDGFKQFCQDYGIDKSAMKLVSDCLRDGRAIMPEQFDSLSSTKIRSITLNTDTSLTDVEMKVLIDSYYEDLENYLNSIAGKKIVEKIDKKEPKIEEKQNNDEIVNGLIDDIEQRSLEETDIEAKEETSDNPQIDDEEKHMDEDAKQESNLQDIDDSLIIKDKEGKEFVYLKDGKIDSDSLVKIVSSKPLKVDHKHYRKLAEFIPGIRRKLQDVRQLEIEREKALNVQAFNEVLETRNIQLDDEARELIEDQKYILNKIDELESKIGVKFVNKFLLKDKKNKQDGSKPSKTSANSVKNMAEFIDKNFEFVNTNLIPFGYGLEKNEEKSINSPEKDTDEFIEDINKAQKKLDLDKRVLEDYNDKDNPIDATYYEEEETKEETIQPIVDEENKKVDTISEIKDKVIEEQSKKIDKLTILYNDEKNQIEFLRNALKKVGNFKDDSELNFALEQYKNVEELEKMKTR